MFLLTALSIWAALHAYVLWSVSRTPLVAGHVPRRALVLAAVVLGLSYLVGRFLDGRGLGLAPRHLATGNVHRVATGPRIG